MRASVAGAPVSFGVFEMTPEGADTIHPDAMLEILAETGYRGVDLGPVGYLGRSRELVQRLERFGLSLAGGWIQLPLTDDEGFAASLPVLRDALSVFADASEADHDRLPLPTLADDGSAARRAAPGRGPEVDPLDDAAWSRLIANAEKAAAIVRAAGFEPTFHHHAGTFVETPEEIDRFLAHVDIDLTLDTGHLFIAGGDPLDAVRRWGERINHLHLKDVDLTELSRVIDSGGGMREMWSSGAFAPFGAGDIDLGGVMAATEAANFDGWLVVEQDVLNGPDVSLDEFVAARGADQRTNREALRAWA